ncbi:MAG: HPr-rel-A system PqqD family peptide chaperone [Magnetococcales bacterium]|nr:HPr-rel-A system PqqD family peptide chaperone [Magnetococcales bacterium]NGZ07151.1 HPr-rel-A system PqqD family peptide chaperone [Magnetococcales bacterium]
MTTSSHISWSWHALNPSSWSQTRCGETILLFNPASNETHVLNTLTRAILELLSGETLTLAQLIDRLGYDPCDQEVVATHARLLWELDQLGLIFPVDPCGSAT